jgi:hypothetical protein
MTLVEKLEQRIEAERAEIARIRRDAVTNEAAAAQRLTLLQEALDTLRARPRLEQLLTSLGALGVKVGE